MASSCLPWSEQRGDVDDDVREWGVDDRIAFDHTESVTAWERGELPLDGDGDRFHLLFQPGGKWPVRGTGFIASPAVSR